MTDKVQKIREEIERVKTVHSSASLKDSKSDILAVQVCINLLSFIDSMQEEPVSEDLEEAALEYANKQLREAGVTDENCPRELAVAQASLIVSGFKAGAKWQKDQMMKDKLFPPSI